MPVTLIISSKKRYLKTMKKMTPWLQPLMIFLKSMKISYWKMTKWPPRSILNLLSTKSAWKTNPQWKPS